MTDAGYERKPITDHIKHATARIDSSRLSDAQKIMEARVQDRYAVWVHETVQRLFDLSGAQEQPRFHFEGGANQDNVLRIQGTSPEQQASILDIACSSVEALSDSDFVQQVRRKVDEMRRVILEGEQQVHLDPPEAAQAMFDRFVEHGTGLRTNEHDVDVLHEYVLLLGNFQAATPQELASWSLEISKARSAYDDAVSIHAAEFDELVPGVYNYAALLIRQSEALSSSETGRGVLLVMDANFFKTVNDTRNYEDGNRVIIAILEALKSIGASVVGRPGGDEFEVLFTDTETDDQTLFSYAQRAAEAVQSALEQLHNDDPVKDETWWNRIVSPQSPLLAGMKWYKRAMPIAQFENVHLGIAAVKMDAADMQAPEDTKESKIDTAMRYVQDRRAAGVQTLHECKGNAAHKKIWRFPTLVEGSSQGIRSAVDKGARFRRPLNEMSSRFISNVYARVRPLISFREDSQA